MTLPFSRDGQDLEPAPTVAGTFALFDTPGGGVHVVVRLAGEEGERHRDIPPHLAGLARQVIEEGSLAGAVRALVSRRGRRTPIEG